MSSRLILSPKTTQNLLPYHRHSPPLLHIAPRAELSAQLATGLAPADKVSICPRLLCLRPVRRITTSRQRSSLVSPTLPHCRISTLPPALVPSLFSNPIRGSWLMQIRMFSRSCPSRWLAALSQSCRTQVIGRSAIHSLDTCILSRFSLHPLHRDSRRNL
jgi:hypothetical protein